MRVSYQILNQEISEIRRLIG